MAPVGSRGHFECADTLVRTPLQSLETISRGFTSQLPKESLEGQLLMPTLSRGSCADQSAGCQSRIHRARSMVSVRCFLLG